MRTTSILNRDLAELDDAARTERLAAMLAEAVRRELASNGTLATHAEPRIRHQHTDGPHVTTIAVWTEPDGTDA